MVPIATNMMSSMKPSSGPSSSWRATYPNVLSRILRTLRLQGNAAAARTCGSTSSVTMKS